MADLKKLTVRALRDLARKHVGPGYSRLKTRSELIAALGRILPTSIKEALEPEGSAPVEPAPRAKANGKKPASPAPDAQRAPAAPASTPAPSQPATGAPASPAKLPPAPAISDPRPPLAPFEESLGELPETYGDDSVVLLPRDPRSLYLHWDFAPGTIERAFAWMPGARARLRLFEADRRLRELDVALESHGYWLHGLTPGRTYRAELLAVAEDGQVRRIGPSSNPMRLPLVGPSKIRDDRFVRVPFELPAGQLAEILRKSAAALGVAGPVAEPAPAPEPFSYRPPPPAPVPGAAPQTALRAGPVSDPGLPALVRFVEPPPFSEDARERIYQMSGGAARALGSSESLPASSPGRTES